MRAGVLGFLGLVTTVGCASAPGLSTGVDRTGTSAMDVLSIDATSAVDVAAQPDAIDSATFDKVAALDAPRDAVAVSDLSLDAVAAVDAAFPLDLPRDAAAPPDVPRDAAAPPDLPRDATVSADVPPDIASAPDVFRDAVTLSDAAPGMTFDYVITRLIVDGAAQPLVATRGVYGFNLDGRSSPARTALQGPADCNYGDYFSSIESDQDIGTCIAGMTSGGPSCQGGIDNQYPNYADTCTQFDPTFDAAVDLMPDRLA